MQLVIFVEEQTEAYFSYVEGSTANKNGKMRQKSYSQRLALPGLWLDDGANVGL
jgi:uncharacterized protein YfaT (DUF1175 family)